MSPCFILWKPRTQQDDFFQPFHTPPLQNHKHSYQQVLKVRYGFRVHIGDTESLCEWLFTNDVAHTIIPLSLSRFYFPTEVSSIDPFFLCQPTDRLILLRYFTWMACSFSSIFLKVLKVFHVQLCFIFSLRLSFTLCLEELCVLSSVFFVL